MPGERQAETRGGHRTKTKEEAWKGFLVLTLRWALFSHLILDSEARLTIARSV